MQQKTDDNTQIKDKLIEKYLDVALEREKAESFKEWCKGYMYCMLSVALFYLAAYFVLYGIYLLRH
jgi:hypothetical protein